MSANLDTIYDQIAAMDRAAAHTDADRKQGGITYTPVHIVRGMVDLLNPGWHETIHEPSCGRGMFAFALVEYWLAKGRTPEEIARWAQEKLFLCDTDEHAVADLRALWVEFFKGYDVLADTSNFVVSDGLFGQYSDRRFDAIVGNPPYVRIQHLSKSQRENIRAKFPGCKKGNVDLYYAFFEDAIARAKRACYIMPNSWFSNQSAKTLRQLAKPRVQALIDFGSELVFAPVRAYTAIVLTGPAKPSDPIMVLDSLPVAGHAWQRVERDDNRWSETGWTPLMDKGMHEGQTLDDVAEIVSGIATLSDKSFLLPSPDLLKVQGQWHIRQVDPDFPEHTLTVPIEFAPRLIKATRATHLGEEGPRILCPYDAAWKIVDEDTLKARAPDLLAWLQRRRETLDGRDKGKTQNYEAWYAYGRRQGFWSPRDDEMVLLVPQMGNGKLQSVQVDLAQTRGRFLFTSGYVLRPKDTRELVAIEARLGTPATWDFVRREGKAWAGDGDYRTIGARALRKLPMPTPDQL